MRINLIYKNITIYIIFFTLLSLHFGFANANTHSISSQDAFIFYADIIDENIPKSFQYIDVQYKNTKHNKKLYQSLQKLIYLDKIENQAINFPYKKEITQQQFFLLGEKVLGKTFSAQKFSSTKYASQQDKDRILFSIGSLTKISLPEETKINNKGIEKNAILQDVYNTLKYSHYNHADFSHAQFIEGAIEGIAKSTNDKYTVYFPALESNEFYETLNGEYEGIGSYVDMEEPGVLKIISPITGSPSEKSGIKGGDQILAVDGRSISKENSLREVINWIKGPAGTSVILTIKRGEDVFDREVKREKIVIKDVEYKKLDEKTFYIGIRSFGENVSENFQEALKDLKNQNNIKKIIIDLRNNGGGYLDQVTEILSYFIEKGETTANVKYINFTQKYKSKGYNIIDFSEYKIILLQNSGTASASEIMAGTIKDYFPSTEIIGEKSYGKGSVQAVKDYVDGSTMKYTIAKWFTGKTEQGIDEVGITPTISIDFDIETFQDKGIDNQLEKAKEIW